MNPLRILVGWDSREGITYQVCRRSIEQHRSTPLQIVPIRKVDLFTGGVKSIYSKIEGDVDLFQQLSEEASRFFGNEVQNWFRWINQFQST